MAIQGFGNVGTFTAEYIHEHGGKVVAISDVTGAKFEPDGIDIPAAIEHVKKHRSLAGFETSRTLSNEDLLTLDVDVLIPAALGSVITKENAADVKAQYVIEAANGPILPEADEILQGNDVIVLPDVLANAGGVTVSYFEWVQNQQYFHWDLERTRTELARTLTGSFEKMWGIATEKHISLRTAAYLMGIGRVGRATVLAGI